MLSSVSPVKLRNPTPSAVAPEFPKPVYLWSSYTGLTPARTAGTCRVLSSSHTRTHARVRTQRICLCTSRRRFHSHLKLRFARDGSRLRLRLRAVAPTSPNWLLLHRGRQPQAPRPTPSLLIISVMRHASRWDEKEQVQTVPSLSHEQRA